MHELIQDNFLQLNPYILWGILDFYTRIDDPSCKKITKLVEFKINIVNFLEKNKIVYVRKLVHS